MRQFNREYYLLLCLSGRSEEAAAYMEEFKRRDIEENVGFEKENETVQANGGAHGVGEKRPVRGGQGTDGVIKKG